MAVRSWREGFTSNDGARRSPPLGRVGEARRTPGGIASRPAGAAELDPLSGTRPATATVRGVTQRARRESLLPHGRKMVLTTARPGC
jgi:hypothetical protein